MSRVCVPIIKHETIGVMQILNKRSGNYTARDRVLLEQFANQGAVAIRDARLFKDLLAHRGLYAPTDHEEGVLDRVERLRVSDVGSIPTASTNSTKLRRWPGPR